MKKKGTGMQKGLRTLIGLTLIVLFCAPLAMAQGKGIYAVLLEKHVTGKRVDYDGFKRDERLLDEYLATLSQTDVKLLSENHLFAYYINVYNAFTLKLVLTKYPGINSIKEISSFFSSPWNKKFILLQNKIVSLDYIEHKILRPRFKDPRVHFAINCASKSCPPLRNEPYKGGILEDQLNDQVNTFINDKKNYFIKEDTLFISRIFKWFKEDFSDNPLLFITAHASGTLKQRLNASGKDLKIEYLSYDWTLNR